MRVNVYRRPEVGGQFSYLAVPEGKIIPDEARNSDWEAVRRGVDVDENNNQLGDFPIEDPLEQITSKGYAITSVKNLKNTRA
ncbi:MAG TPA: DUF6139 family protein [Burkholderiaceae bacterium]|jgi:hypothetical protein|nr:DUF6139 family protein [Burkholderiaceae bacterium]